MNAGRARRLLIAAFAISLLVHLIFALFAHRTFEERPANLETVTIVHRRLSLTKMHTPPPRPRATPVPRPAPTSRPLPKRAHATQSTGEGPGKLAKPTPIPASTPMPSPAPSSVANSCANADLAALVTATAAPPDIPIAARAEGTAGIAQITVQLDAQGVVKQTSIARSTGNPALDTIAATMAKSARYSPALHNCKPTPSAYTFSVKFFAW
jgi:TonB family protein